MKHILFVIPTMEYGGTRSSLLNLLNNISDRKSIKVDLLIINHEGDLMDQIPNGVKVLPESKIIAYALPNIRRKSLCPRIVHLIAAVFNRCFGYRITFTLLCKLFGGDVFHTYNAYDAVIAYQEGIAVLFGSLITAPKHIIWIHSDVDKWYTRRTFERNAYNAAQKIVFVADSTKKIFLERFPDYTSKCCVIKNTLNVREIIKKSKEIIDIPKNNGLRLISIGRFTEAKAFDRIIFVSKELKRRNHNFVWTLVGNGELFTDIYNLAERNDVNDVVNFVGAQSNPFAYIKNSDVVVVSSINESQPMVILESLTLSKPIISTGFGSANEILENGKYGLICDNNKEALLSAVESVFIDSTILLKLKQRSNNYSYDSGAIVNQVLELIG